MILFASSLDDPQQLASLKQMFRPPLTERDTVLGAIEELRLEAARPSEIYKKLAHRFVVDLDILSDVLAKRVAA